MKKLVYFLTYLYLNDMPNTDFNLIILLFCKFFHYWKYTSEDETFINVSKLGPYSLFGADPKFIFHWERN